MASITITVSAPMSRATATALMPSPPAPWMTAVCPWASPALAEGLAHRVRADARAQAGHAAAHLVAEGEVPGERAVDVLHLAAPDVQVGATHACARELHEHRARLGLRHGILTELELSLVRL